MSLCRLEGFAPAPAITHMLLYLSAARVRKSYLLRKTTGISAALRSRTPISAKTESTLWLFRCELQKRHRFASFRDVLSIWDWNGLSTEIWHKLLITFVLWCNKMSSDIRVAFNLTWTCNILLTTKVGKFYYCNTLTDLVSEKLRLLILGVSRLSLTQWKSWLNFYWVNEV